MLIARRFFHLPRPHLRHHHHHNHNHNHHHHHRHRRQLVYPNSTPHAPRPHSTMATPSEPSTKRQRTTRSGSTPAYELLYHPVLPGRGEYVRLVFEATRTPYTDVANASPTGYDAVAALCQSDTAGWDGDGNPPVFAPPALRVKGAGAEDGSDLLMYQTANILGYLGWATGMVDQGDEVARAWVAELVMTALDWNDEAHDTHHPITSMDYYEDQKPEALRAATAFRVHRLPKRLGYFSRVLSHAQPYLALNRLTPADTTLFQVMDGTMHAFPKEMAARRAEFPAVFAHHERIREEDGIKEYLASGRRLAYGDGIYRHYPELDRQEE
ncbi:glutathione S-transferase [Lineolata rhizophorae]|uniref:Glutathione S-transferase n=1 Tax=Lineolata rhizophorae TaxID=578093 RepID=A0A6A6NVQ1_9PEZI|nr:glutathione S-transferase [Lineolata rhizophorae]